MFERTSRNTTRFNKTLHLGLLQPDYSPKTVSGQLAFIDETVKRARGDTELSGRFAR